MTLQIRQSTQFRRDIRRLGRQGADVSLLETVIKTLAAGETLDERYRDHLLTGNWQGYRDCHIRPNWLLIYQIIEGELQLVRTGSHSELYGA